MDFRTRVHISESDFHIDHTKGVMLFGSCFSENIGKKLTHFKFKVDVNPFGILYNPKSISSAVRKLLKNETINEQDLIHYNNLYHSFMHHGSFSDINIDACLDKISHRFNKASENIRSTDVFLFTFGTSYVFRYKKTGEIVNNCHKIPSNKFNRFRLSVEEIVEDWGDLIQTLTTFNPGIKIIFTVSPIRHIKDGAHENQISKSTLHLAIDQLRRLADNQIFYFPAYEIMLDELRDYRFYDEDMLHPSQVALDYIWNRFSEVYFSEKTLNINMEWLQISKSLYHRPLHPDSVAYKKFIYHTSGVLSDFIAKYPYISCEEEQLILQQLKESIS